jgi:MOSC domain-containing protein YiiM
MPSVAHLFHAPRKHQLMVELETVAAIEQFGFLGCSHGRSGSKRQLLLVDKETLEAMNLAPGSIRENVTTTGLNVNGLEIGERLRIGSALVEVTAVCTPCNELEKIRPGLRRELWGRRGMLCRVLQGGVIHKGDVIQREPLALSA